MDHASYRDAGREWWWVAIAAPALGLAIGYFTTHAGGYYIAALAIAVLLGLLFARNMQIGIVLLACLAAFAIGESPAIQSPNSGYKSGVMPSQILAAFLTAIWLARGLLRGRLETTPSALRAPLIVLTLVSLVSLLVNNVLQSSKELLFHQMMITQVAEVGLMLCSVCVFMVASGVLRDARWIIATVIPIVLIGVYVAVVRVLGVDPPIRVAWDGLALSAAIAVVTSRLLLGKPGRREQWALWPVLALMIFAAFSNLRWLSGAIAASVALTMAIGFRSRWAAGAMIALVLVALFIFPGIHRTLRTESETGGDFDRFVIWKDAGAMFMQVNPALGVGPGNYHSYVYYHNTVWFGRRTYTTAHSNYVQMASELGLIGLAALIWVIVGGVRTGLRAARSSPPELRWIGAAAVATFCGVALASVFGDYLFPSRGNNGIINFGTTVYTWLLMGAAAAASSLPDEGGSLEVQRS